MKGGDSNEVINQPKKNSLPINHTRKRSHREVNHSAQDYLRVDPCMHTSCVSRTSPWTANARNGNTLGSEADSHC